MRPECGEKEYAVPLSLYPLINQLTPIIDSEMDMHYASVHSKIYQGPGAAPIVGYVVLLYFFVASLNISHHASLGVLCHL